MEAILLTGGTGTLGRAVVPRVTAPDREVRVLTRRAGPGRPEPFRRVVGDLVTGAGLSAAVDGVSTIVHCATTNGRADVDATRRLVDAAVGRGGRPHLIHVSIVGIDRIPLGYYRAKLEAERIVVGSGLPWTVLRATQFHDLIAVVVAKQRWSPVTCVPRGFRFQPIDTRDVARRLAELVPAGPSARVPVIGGPEVLGIADLARIHHRVHGRRRPVLEVGLPGRVAAQFVAGHNLVPQNPYGVITFERHLTEGAAR